MICEGKLRRYGERVKIGMYSLGLVLDVMAHLSTSFIFKATKDRCTIA